MKAKVLPKVLNDNKRFVNRIANPRDIKRLSNGKRLVNVKVVDVLLKEFTNLPYEEDNRFEVYFIYKELDSTEYGEKKEMLTSEFHNKYSFL